MKRIGQLDDEIAAVVHAGAGQPAKHSLDPNDSSSYLLLRACEAAKKLELSPERRIAVIVVCPMAWTNFEFPPAMNFIDWQSPYFHPGSAGWSRFSRTRGLDEPSLLLALRKLDELWIMRQTSAFELQVHDIVTLGGAAARGLT